MERRHAHFKPTLTRTTALCCSAFFGSVFSLLIALPLATQAAPLRLPNAAEPQAGITLALDNADIVDLIHWAQEFTPKSIIVHPNIQGKVTVMAGAPMTPAEAYEVFVSTLQVHGFAVIESENSIKVIPDAMAKLTSVPTTTTSATPEDIVVQIIKVKNISASQLAGLLQPLVPQVGYLAAYTATNTLIVADRANNIAKVLKIIEQLDTGGIVDIELIPLEFASAKEIAEIVQKLLTKKTSEAADSAVQLAVDERSNSLLITGDMATRAQIRQLVNRLDQPLSGDGNTQVFYLNYSNAKDLVPILESVAGNIQKNQKDRDAMQQEVGVKAAESLNAVVITAPPSVLNTMKGVIAKLDRRKAQVMVEALIVEVNEDVANDLGIEWFGRGTDTATGFRSFPRSPILGIEPGALGATGNGLSFGYFRGGELRSLINALASEANANILSTPTIMALDNEEAQILVGSNVPFITGSESRLNDDPFQTIERKDIGITLKVKPRVNNHESVSLEIEQSVESISQAADVSASDIITNKREIKTKVLINNDEMLVLGGLIRDEIETSEQKVPVLGSIPGLGRLFKSTKTTTVKRNLMVFIRPRILQDAKSSYEVTRERYQDIRVDQTQFMQKLPAGNRSDNVLPPLQDKLQ